MSGFVRPAKRPGDRTDRTGALGPVRLSRPAMPRNENQGASLFENPPRNERRRASSAGHVAFSRLRLVNQDLTAPLTMNSGAAGPLHREKRKDAGQGALRIVGNRGSAHPPEALSTEKDPEQLTGS